MIRARVFAFTLPALMAVGLAASSAQAATELYLQFDSVLHGASKDRRTAASITVDSYAFGDGSGGRERRRRAPTKGAAGEGVAGAGEKGASRRRAARASTRAAPGTRAASRRRASAREWARRAAGDRGLPTKEITV